MRFLLLAALSLLPGFAEAGYNLTVCGSASSRTNVHYARSTNPSAARAEAEAKCAASGAGPCVRTLCEKVFQPTKVSELPPSVRTALNKRLAAIDREASRAMAQAKSDNNVDRSLWTYIDDLKRRQRADEITKALEYVRDCQGSSGCPKR